MFLMFMLLGINALPISYVFSFFKKSTNVTITIISIASIAMGKFNKLSLYIAIKYLYKIIL